MIFLRYKTALTPEMVWDRFRPWQDAIPRNPWNPFNCFTNPWHGVHVMLRENTIRGYYEDGKREGRSHRLKSEKIWFDLTVTPCGEGSRIVGAIYCAPYMTVGLWAYLAVCFCEVSLMGSTRCVAILPFVGLMTCFEFIKQKKVKEQILALVPPIQKNTS